MRVRPVVLSVPRLVIAAAILVAPLARAQEPGSEGAPPIPTFDKTETMVPMRDGVKLHTNIFVPRGFAGNLPIIMIRTPYGIEGGEATFRGAYAELAREGYIFVHQDIRGRYKSEGQFVMLRQMRNKKDPKAIDESTDTYDTIDWLIKNVPHNNGRVGMMGVSYPGWLTVVAMLDPHPALKAVSPQASPADMFIGDDFHHNGAFRLSYGFEYAVMMETNKERAPFAFNDSDTYDWYLKLGSLAHVNEKYLHGNIPSWNNFANHPSYDAFWQKQAVAPYVDRVTVPTLSVAGWWDQEDFYGPVTIYELLEKHDTNHLNFLVVGPWNHGGWSGPSGRTLGNLDFGSATSPDYRRDIQAPFFAYWLKGVGQMNLAEATTFEAGTNKWEQHASWPPKTDGHAAASLHAGRSQAVVHRADRSFAERGRFVRVRSGEPGALSSAADPPDVRPRIDMVALADRRSALSRRTPRRHQLADGTALRRRRDRRRHHGASLRIDHGVRRRLDREAHRRLSGFEPGRRRSSAAISSWSPTTSFAAGFARASSIPRRSHRITSTNT